MGEGWGCVCWWRLDSWGWGVMEGRRGILMRVRIGVRIKMGFWGDIRGVYSDLYSIDFGWR